MALPEIANTYRCTLLWSNFLGVAPRNVFHVFSDTGNETDVFNTLEANLSDGMFDALVNSYTLDQIAIIALDSNSATHIHDSAAGINGGAEGSPIPASAAVVSFRTNTRGSRGRGRMYVGPIGEDKQDHGVLASASQGAMQSAWDDFREAMVGDGRPLVVASYAHADQHAVVTSTVDTLCGTMRRRQDQLR
jgi:hypothetical protein